MKETWIAKEWWSCMGGSVGGDWEYYNIEKLVKAASEGIRTCHSKLCHFGIRVTLS